MGYVFAVLLKSWRGELNTNEVCVCFSETLDLVIGIVNFSSGPEMIYRIPYPAFAEHETIGSGGGFLVL